MSINSRFNPAHGNCHLYQWTNRLLWSK